MYIKSFVQKIIRLFFRPKLSPEAFEAYYYRLPDQIKVEWKRDGKFIIGKVSDGKKYFTTQGRTPEEFIAMVNDALITIYEIPAAYIDELKKIKNYNPLPEERRKLEDATVSGSIFSFKKRQLRAA